MTTIAYRDGVMAADMMLSESVGPHHMHVGHMGRHPLVATVDMEHTIVTGKVQKIVRLRDGGLMGLSGDAECQFIVNTLNRTDLDHESFAAALAPCKSECNCLVVRPDGLMVWVSTDGEGWAEYTIFEDEFAAVGTGRQFAYGAMEFGASAEQAVAIACKRSCYSAVPITTMRLN